MSVHKRIFYSLSQPVSELGLGCWQLGGSDWGNMEDSQAFEILASAVDSGINFLDTADVYGNGRSETLIGRFLKCRREKIFVATKLGRTSDLFPNQYTKRGVRAAIEASLLRLKVEALDLVQLHCIPPAILQQGEVFDWLRTIRDEGKILSFGASVESMAEAQVCLEQEGLASLQIIFNIFRQKPISTLFSAAQQKKVALIVRLPLASGLLRGMMTRQTQFAASDHRNYNRDGQAFNVGETFAGLPYEKGLELVDALKSMVPAGMSMAQMAQRWILDHEAVTTVITGASRPNQVIANGAASALAPLEPGLHDQLSRFYEEKVAGHIRGPY